MPDAVELVKAIKKTAIEAMESTKPVNVYFGKVISAKPLQINVEQKMTLGKKQMILSRHVTDYVSQVTIDWTTEGKSGGSDEEAFALHDHAIIGKKKITVHNGLVVGDEVILIRQQKGQKYLVLDRIGS